MSKFYSLKIQDIKKETEDCVSIAFDIPNDLKSKFQFKSGQYITVKSIINGNVVCRPYSLCSSPNDADYRVAVKEIDNGIFSAYANNSLRIGDTLDVMPPFGHFVVDIDASHNKKYVGFAGGSGITPIMSIIKSVMEKEPNSSFVLVYGNRNKKSIIFYHKFKELETKYHHRLEVYHILESGNNNPDFSGYLTEKKIKIYATTIFNKEEVDEYFLCGPSPMLDIVTKALEELNIPKKKIKLELFTPAITENNADANDTEGEFISSEITLIIDGDEFTFQLDTNETILNAAQNEDIDVPFSCKGGVCSTCKAKVEEGKVRMDKNYSLEPEELENNYVLTCQAHPMTDKVVLDFDII